MKGRKAILALALALVAVLAPVPARAVPLSSLVPQTGDIVVGDKRFCCFFLNEGVPVGIEQNIEVLPLFDDSLPLETRLLFLPQVFGVGPNEVVRFQLTFTVMPLDPSDPTFLISGVEGGLDGFEITGTGQVSLTLEVFDPVLPLASLAAALPGSPDAFAALSTPDDFIRIVMTFEAVGGENGTVVFFDTDVGIPGGAMITLFQTPIGPPVPEPSVLLLLTAGGLALGVRRYWL